MFLPESEELVSAERRTFVVSLGLKMHKVHGGPAPQVLVIKAYSVGQAKRQAVQKMAKGRFQFYNQLHMWKFFSVEDANEPKAKDPET